MARVDKKQNPTLDELHGLCARLRYEREQGMEPLDKLTEQTLAIARQLLRDRGLDDADLDDANRILAALPADRYPRLLHNYAEALRLAYTDWEDNASVEESRNILYAARQLFEAVGSATGVAETQVRISMADSILDPQNPNWDELERARIYFERTNDRARLVKTWRAYGFIHRGQGDRELELEYFQRAADVAQAAALPRAEIVARNSVASTLQVLGRLEEAEACLHEILLRTDDSRFPLLRAGALQNLGRIHDDRGNEIKALQYLQESLTLFRSIDNIAGVLISLLNLASYFYVRGDYATALEYYLQHLQIIREHGRSQHSLPSVLADVANIYLRLGDIEKALTNAQESYDRAVEGNLILQQALAQNVIAQARLRQGRFDDALVAAEASRAGMKAKAEMRWLFRVEKTRVRILNAMTRYEEALALLTTIQEEARSLGGARDAVELETMRGMIYYEAGQVSEALRHYQSSLRKAETIAARLWIARAHEGLARCYESIGRDGDALRHYRLYMQTDKELFNALSDERARRQQALVRVERAEQDRERLRLHNEGLALEVERQRLNLSKQAMHLAQKNELLRQIRETVSKGSGRKNDSQLQRIIDDFSDEEGQENAWESFKREFQALHPEFMPSLARRCPELTPTERRVCTLIRMDLSTKDIRSILFVTTRAVESYRYRIRKKMGLTGDDNLANVLAAL